jgi:hypothetical protein
MLLTNTYGSRSWAIRVAMADQLPELAVGSSQLVI